MSGFTGSDGTLSALKDELPESPSSRRLTHLVVDESLVDIALNDGIFPIGKASDRYKYWYDDEVGNKECTDPPLTLEITCLSHRNPPRYDVILWTHTDIWFEESELGSENRQRLGESLSKLATDLNIVKADIYEESYFKETLRKREFHELLPESYAQS